VPDWEGPATTFNYQRNARWGGSVPEALAEFDPEGTEAAVGPRREVGPPEDELELPEPLELLEDPGLDDVLPLVEMHWAVAQVRHDLAEMIRINRDGDM
jgi:hypothetical protein